MIMKHRNGVLFILVIALCIFCFIGGVMYATDEEEDRIRIAMDVLKEDGILTGSALRYFMNEAKLSPGTVKGFIKDYPAYGWLFDGSFVTYVDN